MQDDELTGGADDVWEAGQDNGEANLYLAKWIVSPLDEGANVSVAVATEEELEDLHRFQDAVMGSTAHSRISR